MTRRIASAPIAPQPSPLMVMGLEALRLEWRRLYGEPPPLRSVAYLRRLIAWRLEAAEAPAALAELKAALGERPSAPALSTSRSQLAPGDTLARDWQGIRHEVLVLPDGRVAYDGGVYESLSAVARQITGVRWNGPRFFGLRAPQ